jgi:hypothetical protein
MSAISMPLRVRRHTVVVVIVVVGSIDDGLADVDEIPLGRALDATDWEARPLYIFNVGPKCWLAVSLCG